MSEQHLADRTSATVRQQNSEVDLESSAPGATGPVGRALLAAIAGYRKLSGGSQPRCRYLPTCSEYAQTAVQRHGTRRGSWLALRRLCRCHPFGSHGFDPVPPAPGSRAYHPPADELLPPEVHA